MKIPKTFRPEKDLEEKTEQLLKKGEKKEKKKEPEHESILTESERQYFKYLSEKPKETYEEWDVTYFNNDGTTSKGKEWSVVR